MIRRAHRIATWLPLLVVTTAGCGGSDTVRVAAPTATATNAPAPTITPPPATPTATTAPTPTATIHPVGPDDITILRPDPEVSTFTFPIDVSLTPGAFDPTSVVATLNGTGLTLSGGPERFAATVQPGPPLRDENVLTITALPVAGGAPVVKTQAFRYLPPKARAQRITDPAHLIHGPLADSRVGDYLLANAVARFAIQDVGQRDLMGIGQFGGNLIDAELVAYPGHDNFLEIQPAVNIETVVNATTAEIINDGQDGLPAVIRTCGPDDTLDIVNASTLIAAAGLNFPASADDTDADVEACTDYSLAPGDTAVRMTTTIHNLGTADLGLYVGDYINGAGELDTWTNSGGGLGETRANVLGFLSYVGVGSARGVDYTHVTLPVEGSAIPRSTFFADFNIHFILQSNNIFQVLLGTGGPTFFVPAGGTNAFTRYFGVGDGNAANAVALEAAVKGTETGTLRGCVRAGGAPAPAARVAVLKRGLVSHFVTGDDGCYAGAVPVGRVQVAAEKRGWPYEGGGTTPVLHEVTIAAGTVVTQDIDLPPTGRLRVRVTDESGAPLPARVSVVGFDPSPEYTVPLVSPVGTATTGVFNDLSRDTVPYGYAWLDYTGANGTVEFDIEPSQYQVVVSRGTEYSIFEQPVTVGQNETVAVDARIARVVDTAGFVSSDFHVHALASWDSRVSHLDRLRQFAGEGVDNIILTEHQAHVDLNPLIAGAGLQEHVHATVGEEVTTWDWGHFNSYPVRIDPMLPSGGGTDWGRPAPAGRHFPAYGVYTLTPAELADLATTGPTSTPDTVIQVNHIDSYFAPLQIDTALVPPQSLVTPEDKRTFRLDPTSGNLFHRFPALELWNGAGRRDQEYFLDERIGVWFNHLNQGLTPTAIADTDTHEYTNLNTAGARTWTASQTDAPAVIDDGQIARSVAAGRAVGGQGVYVQTRLVAGDGSSATADFTLAGSTVVTSSTRAIDLEITVQAPTWAEYDRIEIYANAATEATKTRNDTPVLYRGQPSRILTAGTDFTVDRVTVAPGVPGAERFETRLTVPFADLPGDTWFVVVVRGTDGVSRPLFPVMPKDLNRETNTTLPALLDGNLGQGGTLALGFTNALYADVDGVAGFQAPRAP